MVDIGKILKRAWHILWNYRVLWIFAFLLALMTGGGNGGNGNTGYQFTQRGNYPQSGPGFTPPAWSSEVESWLEQNIEPFFASPEASFRSAAWITGAIFLLVIVIGLLAALVKYPAETAIIRMADEFDRTGGKVGLKAGWKMGWSRRAFRIWLIDLLLGIPALLLVLLLLGGGALIAYTLINGNEAALVAGSFSMICGWMFLLLGFLLFMIFLGLLRQFLVRKAALEDSSVGDSFRQGWAMFKENWKSALLLLLTTLGIGIGFTLASLVAAVILIPAYIVLAIPGAIVAAIPGGLAYGIASIFTSSPWNWIIAVLVALPFFVAILMAPLTFLRGLFLLFDANIWTVAYREMKDLPVPDSISPDATAT
ncbi:MAG: hypothetical protein FJZ96_02895 [Chloroflexi bacterium]|nr:hypothetical protein [Chloroflexota bacterium]